VFFFFFSLPKDELSTQLSRTPPDESCFPPRTAHIAKCRGEHMLMSKYLLLRVTGHVFVFRLLCFFILPFKRNPHPASQISNHPCLSDILAPHLPHPSILPNAWVRSDWLKITSSGRLTSSTEHINTTSLFSRSESVLLCSHQTRDFLSFCFLLAFHLHISLELCLLVS